MIKYKAWHKEKKEMFVVWSLDWGSDGRPCKIWLSKRYNSWNQCSFSVRPDEVELLQFTGRKATSLFYKAEGEMEVYGNDFIEFQIGDYISKGEVEWYLQAFYVYDVVISKGQHLLSTVVIRRILGNKFESTKLLEEK